MAETNGHRIWVRDALRLGTLVAVLGGVALVAGKFSSMESSITHLAKDQATIYRRLDDLEHVVYDHNEEAERWKQRIEENQRRLDACCPYGGR